MAISFNKLGSYGHLGNQMFQYASLKGIAKNCGYDFSIPPSGHRLFDTFEMSECGLKEVNNIVMHELTHAGFEFDRELFDTCPNYTDLYGYFQTERYFTRIEESIRNDFIFKSPNNEYINNLRDSASGNKIVSIHIRRGDYLGLPNYHPTVSLEYYKEAMGMFDDVVFVVFSDDIAWCRAQDVFKDAHILDMSDVDALYTMTMCDHNIIANSSFSWWGAWLNNNYQKIVIAPKVWFGPAYSGYNMSDLIPSRWITL
jgi:hypothetical protein